MFSMHVHYCCVPSTGSALEQLHSASCKSQGGQPCGPSHQPSRPLGPLLENPSKYKYNLVIFPKWTEAFRLPNQEAHTVAKVLTEEWVLRFGHDIVSTQTKVITSSLLCSNNCAGFSCTLLSLFVTDNQFKRDTLLPHVILAYCRSVHASACTRLYREGITD